MVSSDWFCTLSYHFVFFLCPIIWQFSRNSLFRKKGAKIGFFNFQCFKFKFWKFCFFGLLKHYKNRGFSNFLCFLFLKEKKTGKKTFYEFWLFWSKNGRFVTHICFQKKGPETPIFIVFLGCALFGPSCQKREILDTHPKKKKIVTDNWKAHFWVFLVFSCFFSLFFCCFLCFFLEELRVMWGGPKGHLTWP